MNEKSSYKIETISRNVEIELRRLKAQVELFWEKEFKHYIEFGLKDGMNVVEFGSGPGYVTEKLLEAFPNLNILSVENDPTLIDYAKTYLMQKELRRFKVIQKSIMKTGIESNTFDIAITRLLLEHLPDPIGAAREVFRILKPGGRAIFIDNDFEMHIMTKPHIKELRELYNAYCKSRYDEGGNPKIGRELPSILKESGFTKIEFEIICSHSQIVGDEIFLRSEGLGIPSQLILKGYLSSKSMGIISIEWSKMLKSENHSIMRQLFMACGQK